MRSLKILIDREILKPIALINDNLDELVKMPGRLEQFGTKCRRKTNKYSRKLKSAHPLFPGFLGDRTANLTHYHLQVQANSKKIVKQNRCYF